MAPTEKNAAGNVDDTVFGVNVDRQHFLLVDVNRMHLSTLSTVDRLLFLLVYDSTMTGCSFLLVDID